MNNLYDVLEICLQEIEQGTDVDTVLFRYPEFAEELRPILETSVKARSVAVPDPSSDIVRRNRSKVLQQAAQMREAKVRPSSRLWSVPLRRALVSLAVIATLFISSTNLVRAASTTLPGDNLYPVKRTWEDVLVLFTFNLQDREALEVEHENERLHELKELFTEGRSVKVDFAGSVTRQDGDLWMVSKVPVVVSAQTDIRAQSVAIGNAIRVRGVTQSDGTVLAERIDLLAAGVPLPDLDDDDSFEFEQNHSGNSNESSDDHSGNESEEDTPKIEATQSSGSESDSNSGPDSSSEEEPEDKSMSGVVDSINGDILVVNGQVLDISSAEIKGTPKAGAKVKVEGYYDANGVFVVTKIEFENSGSSSGSDDGNSGSDDKSGNDDKSSDDGNKNSNDDGSHDDGGSNSNDSGGDDHSGSGGGGGDD